jgi:hypothetical protein
MHLESVERERERSMVPLVTLNIVSAMDDSITKKNCERLTSVPAKLITDPIEKGFSHFFLDCMS